MEAAGLYSDEEWPYVLTLLPANLDESARVAGALVRQRNVPNAGSLVRMALAYAVSDLSLKDVAAWAGAEGVAEITGPGLFYRLRVAQEWLGQLLAATLEHEVEKAPIGHRLRIVDATAVSGPGATGDYWRAHVMVNPITGGMQSVQLTNRRGGERLDRFGFKSGDIVLGDRAYCSANGVHAVRRCGADVLVRLSPHTIRICDARRQPMSLASHAKDVPKLGAVEYKIQIPVPPEKRTKSHRPWKTEAASAWWPARVVAGRTRDGKVIWVLTTLSKKLWPAHKVLELYRFRWQIELLFKRLKSILHLDTLPSRMGPLAKSWMLARLLAAALIQKLTPSSGALSPWGYEIRPNNAVA